MSNNRITPFVKRMRTNGGTIYTFSSAVEDIGLNINERNNVVKISHFALLDIPSIDVGADINQNFFNVEAIDGAFEYEAPSASVKDGRVLIAESFQNYALNFENILLNQSSYDPTLIRTVTERVFWKWMKETGAVRFQPDVSTATKQYWSEEIDADGSLGYNSVVKYLGPVSAGNVRTDSFGTYNETYVLVPTSHGQTDAYFEIIEDSNYRHGLQIRPDDPNENILGRGSYTLPHPDGLSYRAYYDYVDSSTTIVGGDYTLEYDDSTGVYSSGWWWTPYGFNPINENYYLTDSSAYLSTGIYNTDLRYTKVGGTGSPGFEFRRSKVDCLSLVSSLDELKDIYGDTELTYDKMAIEYSINDSFNFNAVLIYYTVYNSTEDEVLGRNLLGVLFTDAPSGNSSLITESGPGIIIPSLEKIQSGVGGFGTSYSLRLNIKTDNMVDDTTATIVDQATSDQLYAEDWTEAFANLNTAVNILTQNSGTLQYISEQYVEVQSTQTQILNDIQALQFQVNDIGRDIQGVPNTIAMFADGDDPLIESSIYMRFGNVGIQEEDPKYPLDINGTTKADDIIIENAIRDTSGNILLGYGSPLQIGSSTNYRQVDIYTGGNDPVVTIDTSSFIYLGGDVSISGDLDVEGDSVFSGSVFFDGSITSPTFDFSKEYLIPANVGSGLQWDPVGKFFNVVASSDVSAAGPAGSIQISNGSALSYDPSLYWSSSEGTLEIIGNITASGDLYANLPSSAESNAVYFNTVTRKLSYGVAPGGDVKWSGGNVGSNNQLIKANGDGSIVSESNLTFDGTDFNIAGNISFDGGGDRTISLADPGLASGNDLTIIGGEGGVFGAIGLGGGNIILKGGPGGIGSTSTGNGGNTEIRAGLGEESGIIYIGERDTSVIWIGPDGEECTTLFKGRIQIDNGYVDIGTPGTNEVLFIDSDQYLKRGTVSGGAVSSISNNTSDYVLTAGGGSTIYGESALKVSTGVVLVNDSAADVDFRVESLTKDNMFKVDAGLDGVFIGAATGSFDPDASAYLNVIGDNVMASSTTVNINNKFAIEVRDDGSGDGFGTGIRFTTGAGGSYNGTAAIVGYDDGGYGAGSLLFAAKNVTTITPSTMPVFLNLSGLNQRASWYNAAGTEEIRFNLATGQGDFNGDVVAYSTLVSDQRLKENIQPIGPSLDKIIQLEGVSYDRKSNGESHVGLIAQEVEKVIPEVVVEKTLPLESGDEETLYKTLRYQELIPYLIESIKELKAEIEELKKSK